MHKNWADTPVGLQVQSHGNGQGWQTVPIFAARRVLSESLSLPSRLPSLSEFEPTCSLPMKASCGPSCISMGMPNEHGHFYNQASSSCRAAEGETQGGKSLFRYQGCVVQHNSQGLK